ncbi:HD family phosphohydrolase [Bacteroidota bacterium]
MTHLLSYLRNNHERLQRVLLFLIAAVLLVLLIPKEGQFKYEYQKGKPWLHEDLIAPFDFALEKQSDELSKEIAEVRANAQVYLKADFSVLEKAQAKLRVSVRSALAADTSNARIQKIAERHIEAGDEILKKIYSKGVIQKSDELENLDSWRVSVLDGNVATATDLNQFYTVNTAYALIRSELSKTKRINEKLLTNVLSDIIVQNVFYDQATTEQFLNEDLEAISPTRGMIQKGLAVINKGDIVDGQNFSVLESLKNEYESRLGSSESYYLILLGQCIMVTIVLLMFYMFLSKYRTNIAQNNWQITFLLMLIVLMVALASTAMRIDNVNLYLVPFCLLPVIVRSFFDSRIALFSYLVTLIIIGFEAPNGFEFIFLQLIAGIVAIFSLLNLQNRSQLFVSMLVVFVTYSASYFSIAIMQEGDIQNINLGMFGWFAGSVGLTLLAYPLIYLFEKTFGFISDVTLLELNNTNHSLLRQMATEAPGTFQHSLQVASLAENAVYEVGGNALLVRTGALYHDIGKLYAPMYFVENQVTGVNPHDELSFEESAKIIINHVIKGIELAKKHKLPEQLIDFIRTHHGTSTVQYFYKSYLKDFPEGDSRKADFSYPGPRPFTKEMAILMMADSVEAASRSLKVYTPDSVGKLVDSIIDYQLKEGQFEIADITLKNIADVRVVFKKKLINIYHVRMEYPS